MSGMTMGRKLTVGLGSVLAVAVALGGAYLYSVASLGGELKTATGPTATKLYLAADIEAQLFRMRSCQRGVLLFSLEQLAEQARTNKEEFETRAASVESLIGQLKPLIHLAAAQADIAAMESELPNFKGHFEEVAAASLAGDAKGALKIYTDSSSKSLDKLETSVHDLVGVQKQLMEDAAATSSK